VDAPSKHDGQHFLAEQQDDDNDVQTLSLTIGLAPKGCKEGKEMEEHTISIPFSHTTFKSR
jgi:hypothetical protein